MKHPRELTIGERLKLNDLMISNSQIDKYNHCPKAWDLQYRQNLRGEKVRRNYLPEGRNCEKRRSYSLFSSARKFLKSN